MDDENLIEKVRLYDELYNMAHKKYSDNHHKDIIWTKIGKELNTTGTCNFIIILYYILNLNEYLFYLLHFIIFRLIIMMIYIYMFI